MKIKAKGSNIIGIYSHDYYYNSESINLSKIDAISKNLIAHRGCRNWFIEFIYKSGQHRRIYYINEDKRNKDFMDTAFIFSFMEGSRNGKEILL